MQLIKNNRFFKDIHYYNYTEPKVSDSINHAWIYLPSMTKQRSSSGPCSKLFFLDCHLKLSSIHQTNICSICTENILNFEIGPLDECLDPPRDVAPT